MKKILTIDEIESILEGFKSQKEWLLKRMKVLKNQINSTEFSIRQFTRKLEKAKITVKNRG